MNFTVGWRLSAEEELARIYNAAAAGEKTKIERAANSLDRMLKQDWFIRRSTDKATMPFTLEFRPLTIEFSVSEADRLVTVTGVWLSPPKPTEEETGT
jgi:hypothetical protein